MACKQDIMNMSITSKMIHKSVTTFALSKRLTRTVMRATILNILYQRLVLNQSDLKTREVEGVPIIVFKRDNPKDPLLRQYLDWMKGIVDAIDKNYLKEVFLFMKKPHSDEPFETYRFSLKYNMDENKENKPTPLCVKRATMEIMQVITNLGKNKKLGEETKIQIELTYNETTPMKYEPPGFHASFKKIYTQVFNCNVHLGSIKTGFHRLSCHGGGEVFETQMFDLPTQEMSVEGSDDNAECFRGLENVLEGDTTVSLIEDEEPAQKVCSPKRAARKINISGITVSDNRDSISILSDSTIEMTEEQFFCLCQLTHGLDVDTIECVHCKKEYHAPCQGYLSKEHVSRVDFVCIRCNGQDAVLREITEPDQPLFCRIRLVLYCMNKRGRLPDDLLNLLPENHRNLILDKLESFKILVSGRSGNVDPVALRQMIHKFFQQDDSQVFLDA